jgi:hypothetical protein
MATKVDSRGSDNGFRVIDRRDSDTYKLYDDSIPVSNLDSVKREIQRMALLVPRSILPRLEERFEDQWSDILEPDAHKEAQMVKKRLLLYAMRAWNGPEHKMDKGALPVRATQGAKVAAIFESQGELLTYLRIKHCADLTFRSHRIVHRWNVP